MAITYNPHDIFCVQRNATSSSFVETILRATPNSIVYFDSGSAITTLSTQSFAEQVVSASLTNFTASLAINAISASHSETSSYSLRADTASFSPGSISSSHATQANTASLLIQEGALDTYVPIWQNNQLTSGSAIYIVDGKYVSVNSASYLIDPVNTPALYVKQLDPDNFNVALFEGTVNENFLQLTVDNKGVGAAASADLVVSSNVGNNFVNLGINNSDYNVPAFNITSGSDGYLYASQGSLAIGTSTPGKVVKFFAGGTTSNKEVARVTEGGLLMSGSLFGTASWASISVSASYSPVEPNYSASVSTYFGTKQATLITGNIYTITSSWAEKSTTSSYSPVEPDYSSSVAILINSKQPTLITGNTYTITSSWSEKTTAADSASYIVPGATLYVVSSSTNPSYIEPFNIPTVPYTPPYKEGRMFYDKDYSNWVYYTDQNFKLHIGKEVIWRVYNAGVTTLTTGTPVYMSGSTNLVDPDVWPGIADGTNRYSDVVGVMRYDTPSGQTGYVIQAGVIHGIDMTGFAISDDIFLSSTVLGGLTNIDPAQPYESVQLGHCQVAGISGSFIIGLNFRIPPVIAYAGMTTVPTITSDGSGSIYVTSGSVNLYANSSGFGGVLGYPILASTMSLTTGSTNYLIAELSQSLGSYRLTTDDTVADGVSIVRVATLDIFTGDPTGSQWDVHQFNVGIVGLALANRINNRDIRLYGYQREDGLTLYTTGSSGSFGITDGTIWYGPNDHTVPTFDTTLGGHYTYIFHPTSSNGTSSWHRHTSSVFLTGVYSSGSNDSFVTCAPLSWSVNFVYRLIGTDDESAIILSSAQFATELEASNNAATPPNLPSTIRDMGLLVGRFIVQSGSYDPTIESAFLNTFIPAVVTEHESLLGLQGGGPGHAHLKTQEYSDFQGATGTGVYVRQTGASITGSLQGTSSWANNATSASYSPDITSYTSSLFGTSSWAKNATSASYSPDITSYTSSLFGTSSWAKNATTAISTNTSTGNVLSILGLTVAVGNASFTGTGTFAQGTTTIQTTSGSGIGRINTNQVTASLFGTSSWANNATSASFAPVEPNYSASVSVYFGTKQDTLVVAATYSITASSAISASWAPGGQAGSSISSSWASASISASYAEQARSASWAPSAPASEAVSASWASSSFSASYAPTNTAYSASVSTQFGTKQDTLVVAGTYTITSSWANNVPASGVSGVLTSAQAPTSVSASYASSSTSASFAPVQPSYSASVSTQFGTKQDTLVTGNTYTITSSWTGNASTASFLTRNRTYEVTSSWAEKATTAATAISASFASASISASYAPSNVSVFSRGGTFYDPYGIAGQAALSQSIYVWRAPFACTATIIYGIMDGINGITSSVTAWHNDLPMLKTHINITASHVWVQNSSSALISASFATGDRLSITLLTCSLGMTQSSVQIDFTRP